MAPSEKKFGHNCIMILKKCIENVGAMNFVLF